MITGYLTPLLPRTDTPFPISMTSMQAWMAAPFSPRSTFRRVITRFQWRLRTFTRQQSSPHSACLSLCGCQCPFGLSNAGQTFQRLMDHILRDLPYTFVYLDDILIASRNQEKHAEHLRQTFQVLADNNLVINRDKCVFSKTTLDFLGHTVSKNGITPPEFTASCRYNGPIPSRRFTSSWEQSTSITGLFPMQLRSYAPYTLFSRENLRMGQEQSTAFQKAKQALSDATLLVHPNVKAVTAVTCDASGTAVGASLDQLVDGEWKPLAFFSRKSYHMLSSSTALLIVSSWPSISASSISATSWRADNLQFTQTTYH